MDNKKSNDAIILSLKLGRRVFDITENDKFMDNGSCVQIITRKVPSGTWWTTCPKLSKKAIKEISTFEQISHPHQYSRGVKVFSLKNKTE